MFAIFYVQLASLEAKFLSTTNLQSTKSLRLREDKLIAINDSQGLMATYDSAKRMVSPSFISGLVYVKLIYMIVIVARYIQFRQTRKKWAMLIILILSSHLDRYLRSNFFMD